MSNSVRCPSCQSELPPLSGDCPQCGFQVDKRRRRADIPPGLLRHWDSHQSAIYQASAICVLVVSIVGLVLGLPREGSARLIALAFLAVIVGAAGYQLLSYRVTLSRDNRGRILLHKRRYLAWIIPLWSVTVRLADYDSVRTDWHGPSSSVTVQVLTDDRRQDMYVLELYRSRDCATVTVYRGPDEELMKDLADVLREQGGLSLTRK
jgi:hypothetical protein